MSMCAQNGDVHIKVAAVNIALGMQLQSLQVYPVEVAPSIEYNRCGMYAREVWSVVNVGPRVALVWS